MRLTLRTMLAYLDDVLDAGDAATLGDKIEESEFASNLVSRIRASISQQRLAAPAVDGKGIGRDANSVAEYLDSTLPVDKVPDFERVCLESDAHLAEVAACHQVLTLVLGKPASVPAPLRERAYRFGSSLAPGATHESSSKLDVAGGGHRLDHAHASATAQAGVDISSQVPAEPAIADPPIEEPMSEREKAEVPEYLREGRRQSQLVSMAVAVCILLLLGSLATYAAITYFGDDLAQNDPQVNEPADGEINPRTVNDPSEATNTETPTDVNQPAEPIRPIPTVEEGTPDNVPVAEPDTETERPLPTTLPPTTLPPSDIGNPEIPPTIAPPGSPVAPSDNTTPPAIDPDLAPEVNPDPAEPPPSVDPATPDPVPEELSPVDVGRYLSGDKALARMTPDNRWMRLPANSALRSGDRLLALPAFRPQVALTSGITLTLDGPTRLDFLRPENEEAPRIDLAYGNLLVITVAREGSPLELKIRDLEGTIRLADADTILAIEADPVRAPGVNPLTAESSIETRIICLSGRVDWIANDGTAAPIPAGELLSFVDGGLGQLAKLDVPPAWVDDKAVSLTDRDAARMLEQRLEADRPLALTLSEIAVGPRADLRSLAVRGLAYLDNHDSLIGSLNDNSQRSSWAAEVDAVHRALARGTASAKAVQKSLQAERSGTATELFQLLVGFSQDDLVQGADAKLVEYLDHDAQEFRVLAIENLRRITGATHLYRPEYTPQRRKMYVQAWRTDLEAGNIRYPEANPLQ